MSHREYVLSNLIGDLWKDKVMIIWKDGKLLQIIWRSTLTFPGRSCSYENKLIENNVGRINQIQNAKHGSSHLPCTLILRVAGAYTTDTLVFHLTCTKNPITAQWIVFSMVEDVMIAGVVGVSWQVRWYAEAAAAARRRKALQPQVAFSQEQASAQGGRNKTLKQAPVKETPPLRGRCYWHFGHKMAKRMPTVNSVKEQADAELYFEMEFPGKDPDTISFSSKSIESFSSETTNPDSR